ncbi:MAG: hypothetical protein QOJ66_1734 [Ilumatobacteraceae bacterium]
MRRFTVGDRTEHAVQGLSQRHSGGELLCIVVGAIDLLVAAQQARRDRPLEHVVRRGKVVSSERRSPVDRVDEIDHGVVAGEVEGPTRRGDDDRRTIPDHQSSQVSPAILTLTVATIAPCRDDHH